MDPISDLVLSYFDLCDKEWMQRQRLPNTRKIFGYITEAAISKKGIDHIILQDNAALSPAALCRARQKLPIDAFYYINETIIHNNAQLSRVFAVDGSKVHVPASFKSYGYKSRTNDKPVSRKAKHPFSRISRRRNKIPQSWPAQSQQSGNSSLLCLPTVRYYIYCRTFLFSRKIDFISHLILIQ